MLSKASINVAPRTAAYPTTAPWCHEAPTGGYSWKACCWLRGPEHWWEVCDWFQSENTERWLIYSEKISAEIRTLVCIEHREMDPLMPKLSCRKKSLCLSFFIFCFKMFFLSLLKRTVYTWYLSESQICWICISCGNLLRKHVSDSETFFH